MKHSIRFLEARERGFVLARRGYVGIFFAIALGAMTSSARPQEARTSVGADTELRAEVRHMSAQLDALQQTVEELRRMLSAGNTKTVASSAAGPVDIPVEPDRVSLGDREARVVVVEFTDFQCPFCGRFYRDTFPGLRSAYIDSGKVRLIVHNFPLEFHGQAKAAAVAADCAGQQQRYWQMTDALFSHPGTLDEETYGRLGRDLGLDESRFAACRTDPAELKNLAADESLANSVGVRGTPSFFVGRVSGGKLVGARQLVGAQGLPALAAVIDPLLAESSAH